MPTRVPRPRTKLHSAVETPKPLRAMLVPGKRHAHGCTACGRRYTDACQEPLVNRTCSCVTGHARSQWDRDSDPQDCCRLYSQPVVNTETLARYALGGDEPWFQCQTCFRTHPRDPRE